MPLLAFLGGAAGPVAIVLVTIVLTFLTLVFGELAPKRVAMQRAETWALLVARPLSMIATVSRPVVWCLAKSTDLAVRLMGGDPGMHREEISPEEIRDLVATHRGFSPEQRLIISGAVEISERVLREVLVSGRKVFTLDAATPAGQASRLLAASGHSRAPVISNDTVAGLVLAPLGRVPTTPGETVTSGGWTLQVTAVDRHAITQVRLQPADQDTSLTPAG